MAPGGITLAGPTHITETLVVDKLATFRNDISVTGDNGGTGNITTRGSVLAGQEVQDRQGTMMRSAQRTTDTLIYVRTGKHNNRTNQWRKYAWNGP